MKKIAVFLLLALMLCIGFVAHGETDPDAQILDNSEKVFVDAEMERQDKVIIALNDIWRKLVKNNGSGNEIYPDDYAGAYYKDGKAIILLTDMSDTQKYIDSTQNADILEFVLAKYSYNELLDAAENISATMSRSYDVTMYEVDEKQNCINVGVIPSSLAAAKNFNAKAVIADVPVNIIPMEKTSFSTTYYGGQALYIPVSGSTSRGGYTSGFGLDSNKLVTANHGLLTKGASVYTASTGGTAIGTVSEVEYGSSGDYAIIALSSSHTSSNQFYITSSTRATVSGTLSPVVDTVYNKYGMAKGAATLTCKSTSTTLTGGIIVFRTEITSGSSAPGDSGGPIWRYTSSKYYAVGIVTGSNVDGTAGVGDFVYVTKVGSLSIKK